MTLASQLSDTNVPSTSPPRACDKVRVRFVKGGDIRLVSHRDLMKCVERILRRADLPMFFTQGFHPMPRMVFAMSLGLGIVGLEEVLELEFRQAIEPADIQERLVRQMPPGMRILSVKRIPVKTTAQPRRVGYRLALPGERILDARLRVADLLAADNCWIDRVRPAARRFDLRPLISELRLVGVPPLGGKPPEGGTPTCGTVPPEGGTPTLEMLLWVTPTGAARPDEVLTVLGLDNLVSAGAVVERFLLELLDESQDSVGVPPSGGRVPPKGGTPTSGVPTSSGAAPREGGTPTPTALISGPMNFDS